MPLMRRTLIAFVVTFCCALAVFTVPSIAWNSLRAEPAPAAAAEDSAQQAAPIPTPAVQHPPRSVPQRLIGILGILTFLGIAVALSHNRRAISPRVLFWGLGLQALLAVFVLRVPAGREIFVKLGAAITALLGILLRGYRAGLRGAGQAELEPRDGLRVPGAARHHLRFRAVRHPLPPRGHAARGEPLRAGDEQDHGGERRREHERGGVDLHGSDRGAPHHPADSWHG